jgi:peptide/nickel transport system substrate-binding protein
MAENASWSSPARPRLSRRGVLRGGALAGAGIALAGCTQAAGPPTAAPATVSSGAVATAGPAGGAAPSPTPAGARPKYGGTLTWLQSADTAHLDVHQTSSVVFFGWGPAIAYSKLLRFDGSPARGNSLKKVAGELAQSWEQPDGVTYIFKLHQGVKFHNFPPVNGREVTAEDVVKSYDRQIKERVGATFLGPVDRYQAVDKYTLRLTLKQPDADFLEVHADTHNRIIPIETVDLKGDLKEGPIIGSGPWIHETWLRDDRSTMLRNPDYFMKGVPYVDRLEFQRVRDAQTQLAIFRSGQSANSPPGFTRRDLDPIKRDNPGIVYHTFRSSTGSGLQLVLNITRPPYNDKRVRHAISKAIDRQAVIDTVYDGAGFLTAGLSLPDLDWSLPEAELKTAFRRDVEGAKRLLAEAGYPNGFDGETFFLNLQQPWVDSAELVNAQLREAGIRMTLKPADAQIIVQQVHIAGDFQTYFGTGNPPFITNAMLYNQHHSSRPNAWSGIRDPKLDELIDRQVGQRNAEERKRILLEVQRYLLDSAHQLMVFGFENTSAFWPWAKDAISGYPSGESDNYTWIWLDK